MRDYLLTCTQRTDWTDWTDWTDCDDTTSPRPRPSVTTLQSRACVELLCRAVSGFCIYLGR